MTQAFNLSQFANFVNSSGKADLTTAVTGVLPVANGGSGAATFSSGSVLLGSGTSSFGTVAPGTAGNLLTSNGTAWTSAVAPPSGINMELFTANGTWTPPTGITKAIVWVWGGGGGAYSSGSGAIAYGGQGGACCVFITGITGAIAVTVGTGGGNSNPATSGNTSSFGTYITCTGGSGATQTTSGTNTGANGTVTTSGVTVLRSGTGLDMPIGSFAMKPTASTLLVNVPYGSNSQTWTTGAARPGTGGVSSSGVTGWTGSLGCGGAVLIQY